MSDRCNSSDNSPTSGVMAEVKTELLWTTNVTPAPTNMAMYPVSHPNGEGRSVEKNITFMQHASKAAYRGFCVFSPLVAVCFLHIRRPDDDTLCTVNDPAAQQYAYLC